MRRGSARQEEMFLRFDANDARHEQVLQRLNATERGMQEIIRRLDEMDGRRGNRSAGGDHDYDDGASENRDGRNGRGVNQIAPINRRLEIPVFFGDDAFDWISKVERYFTVNNIAEAEKVSAVLVVLEGEALHWYHWWETGNRNATWDFFRRELLSRFQPEALDNPYRALYTLKQRGSIAEFRAEFE